jgi:riboflavin kinase/FMN adenylyltransferase
VYATEVVVDAKVYDGATNIGCSPTFKDKVFSIETHILDFNQDIYGKVIQVRFIERLREEKTFSSPEELSQQIRKDVERAREVFVKHRSESRSKV